VVGVWLSPSPFLILWELKFSIQDLSLRQGKLSNDDEIVFTPCESVDEMLTLIRDARIEADARITREQWDQVRAGTYGVSFRHGLIIFYKVLETYMEEHLVGYVFCKGYSIACVHGEMGDVHRSDFAGLISKKTFELARSMGWNIPRRLTR